MHVPQTLALFAATLALLIVLRLRWPQLSGGTRMFVIAVACAPFVMQGLFNLSGLSSNSEVLRSGMHWVITLAYEFFVLLLTLLRPRWLTVLIAVVLILPLLSASAFFPLTEIFDLNKIRTVPLPETYFVEITPWDSVLHGTSGVDVEILRRAPHLPFLRRHVGAMRLYNNQCNTAALQPELQPDRKAVLLRCPAWPESPTENDPSALVPIL